MQKKFLSLLATVLILTILVAVTAFANESADEVEYITVTAPAKTDYTVDTTVLTTARQLPSR